MTVPTTNVFAPANRSARRETRLFDRTARFATCAVLFGVLASGCQSLGLNQPTEDEQYRKLSNTDGILGPMARAVQTSLYGDVQKNAVNPELTKQLDAANRLYSDGKYGEAAATFRRIASTEKLTAFGEEAQFMLGESYYQQGRFANAQDAYEKLLEDYPSTRRVDDVTNRLFRVASAWLDVPIPKAAASDIQQASYEDGGAADPQKLNTNDITVKVPLLPNFHDKSRPMFDTKGRALLALKSIWLNDPTGPLADDALMMTATHYLKKNNYVEADRYYKILREDFAKSPHVEKAFVLGSHAKMMSYQGPHYEGNTLKQARELKESTLRLFPNNEQRQKIREELQDIYDAEARRQWVLVEFWQKKGEPRAVALQCRQLMEAFPESKYAEQARAVLGKIDPKLLSDLPGF